MPPAVRDRPSAQGRVPQSRCDCGDGRIPGVVAGWQVSELGPGLGRCSPWPVVRPGITTHMPRSWHMSGSVTRNLTCGRRKPVWRETRENHSYNTIVVHEWFRAKAAALACWRTKSGGSLLKRPRALAGGEPTITLPLSGSSACTSCRCRRGRGRFAPPSARTNAREPGRSAPSGHRAIGRFHARIPIVPPWGARRRRPESTR